MNDIEREKKRTLQELKAKGISHFRTLEVYNLDEIEEGLHCIDAKRNTHIFFSIKRKEDGSKYLEIETFNPHLNG